MSSLLLLSLQSKPFYNDTFIISPHITLFSSSSLLNRSHFSYSYWAKTSYLVGKLLAVCFRYGK